MRVSQLWFLLLFGPLGSCCRVETGRSPAVRQVPNAGDGSREASILTCTQPLFKGQVPSGPKMNCKVGSILVVVKIMVPSSLGSLNTRCRIILRTQKGTIILITTHIPNISFYNPTNHEPFTGHSVLKVSMHGTRAPCRQETDNCGRLVNTIYRTLHHALWARDQGSSVRTKLGR